MSYAAAGGFAMPCAVAKPDPKTCAECGTHVDDVPFGPCSAHALAAIRERMGDRPPELSMDERPFAPQEPIFLGHSINCDFHVDQYRWECTCGGEPNPEARRPPWLRS